MGFLLGLVQVVVYLLLENVHLSDYICQLFLFLPCVSAEKRGIDHCMEHWIVESWPQGSGHGLCDVASVWFDHRLLHKLDPWLLMGSFDYVSSCGKSLDANELLIVRIYSLQWVRQMTRSQCCATYSYVRYSADYFDYFGIWHDGSRKTPSLVHITLQYATSNDSFFYVNLQVRGFWFFLLPVQISAGSRSRWFSGQFGPTNTAMAGLMCRAFLWNARGKPPKRWQNWFAA